MDKPVPIPDATSSFYWEGALQERLLIQRCGACDRYQYPPEVACPACQSDDLRPTQVSGRGTLYSMTVVRQAFHPAFAGSLPYIVGLVELAEAPRLRVLTNIVDADASDLEVGTPLEVTFERRGDTAIPQFRPAREGSTS